MTPAAVSCWCRGALEPTRIRGEGFSLLRCARCGTFKIDPPPIVRDEQSGDFYTAYYAVRHGDVVPASSDSGTEPHSRYWRVVAKVASLRTAARTVIDFGSGEGGLCHELAEAGWKDVVGLDVSRARVARARRRYPGIRFYDRPLRQTDLAAHSADLCVMDNVIEHLTEPQAVLEEIRQYIRPGGKIVVITPNMESGMFRFLGRRWTPELAPHAHIFLFTPGSLTRALTDAGFVVETVGSFQQDWCPPGALARRLVSGDVKGAVWRAHQELGALYSRITGAGPMVFAVGEVPAALSPASQGQRPGPVSSALGDPQRSAS